MAMQKSVYKLIFSVGTILETLRIAYVVLHLEHDI